MQYVVEPICERDLPVVKAAVVGKVVGKGYVSMDEEAGPALEKLGFKWSRISGGIKEMFIADRVEEAGKEKHLVHFRIMEMGDHFGVSFHVNVLGEDNNFTARYFRHKLTDAVWTFTREGKLLFMKFEDETGSSRTSITVCIGRVE